MTTCLQPSNQWDAVSRLSFQFPVAHEHGYELSLARQVHFGRNPVQSTVGENDNLTQYN